MTEQQSDEQGKLEARQRDFGERFAAWWNRGAEKARQGQATPVASETATPVASEPATRDAA